MKIFRKSSFYSDVNGYDFCIELKQKNYLFPTISRKSPIESSAIARKTLIRASVGNFFAASASQIIIEAFCKPLRNLFQMSSAKLLNRLQYQPRLKSFSTTKETFPNRKRPPIKSSSDGRFSPVSESETERLPGFEELRDEANFLKRLSSRLPNL